MFLLFFQRQFKRRIGHAFVAPSYEKSISYGIRIRKRRRRRKKKTLPFTIEESRYKRIRDSTSDDLSLDSYGRSLVNGVHNFLSSFFWLYIYIYNNVRCTVKPIFIRFSYAYRILRILFSLHFFSSFRHLLKKKKMAWDIVVLKIEKGFNNSFSFFFSLSM